MPLNDFISSLRMLMVDFNVNDKNCCSNNRRCNLFGHKASDNLKQILYQLKWEKMPDGFEYKELMGKCQRCGCGIVLFMYPKWEKKIFTQRKCYHDSLSFPNTKK